MTTLPLLAPLARRLSASHLHHWIKELHSLVAGTQPGDEAFQHGFEQLAHRLSSSQPGQVELRRYPYGPEHRYFSWTKERRPITEQAELWLV